MLEIVDKFADVSLLTFFGVTFIPVMLFWRRDRLVRVDRGFVLIIFGVSLVSAGTLLEYFIRVIENFDILSVMSSEIWRLKDTLLAVILYVPGTVTVGIGMSSWLPALQRLDREIDRRKQTESELRALAGELESMAVKAEEANHAKSTFLASMSHELRTPLNAIIGFSEMIRSEQIGPIENSRYVEYGDLIGKSGTHLLSIISDVLDISKVEAGKLELEEEPFSVEQALHDCIHLMAGQIEEARVELVFDLQIGQVNLRADPRILKQIFINLLSNALKFTDEGGTIVVNCVQQPQHLRINVEDDGIGMNADEIDHVVRPFAQVENVRTRSHTGTGLGLTIVKEMMELHGGELVLESEPGKGTKAGLVFPAERLLN